MKARRKGKSAFVVIGTGIGGAIFRNGELQRRSFIWRRVWTELLSNGQTFSEIGTAVKMAQRYCERIGVENRR